MHEVIEAPETSKYLATIAEQSGLAPSVAESLVVTFVPHAEAAARLIAEAEAIVVTDATQVSEMKASRAKRLALRQIRIDTDKDRVALKEESLKRGKAIDAVAGFIKGKIEPVETRLEEQEKFAERAEAARKARLKSLREDLLRPYGVDTQHYQLGEMTADAFAALLDATDTAHKAKAAAAAKAEADRIAAEEARKAEEARLRAENERLAAEKSKAEKAAAEAREQARQEALAAQARADVERQRVEAERRAAEAKLRAEREAREKLEREEAERKAAAEAKARAEEAAAKKAARAPDKVKIAAVAIAVRGLAMPEVSSPEAKSVVAQLKQQAEKFAAWIDSQASQL